MEPYSFHYSYLRRLHLDFSSIPTATAWVPVDTSMKGLAFAGGVLLLAGSYYENIPFFLKSLAKTSPFGGIFFLYNDDLFWYCTYQVRTICRRVLAPAWIPFHTYWTYFTGAALIGAGVAICDQIQPQVDCEPTGYHDFLMVYFSSHTTCDGRLLGDSVAMNPTSLSQSLGFSGIALMILHPFQERRIDSLASFCLRQY
ncbi:MAG: hypothetical protein QM734_06145 [Cyclobacteriaceae bacterium]